MYDEMAILIEAIRKMPTPIEIPSKLAYLAINKQDDLVAQIVVPPLHAKIHIVVATNFKIQEVILGKPTKDTT